MFWGRTAQRSDRQGNCGDGPSIAVHRIWIAAQIERRGQVRVSQGQGSGQIGLAGLGQSQGHGTCDYRDDAPHGRCKYSRDYILRTDEMQIIGNNNISWDGDNEDWKFVLR